MHAFRNTVRSHRLLAALILALALLVRLAVPTGYMLMPSGSGVVLAPCSGTGPMIAAPAAAPMAHPMMNMADHQQHQPTDDSGHQNKAEQPCAFSLLSAPPIAAADPYLLVLAILFVLAVSLRPTRTPLATAFPRLRPPLRAPPATA